MPRTSPPTHHLSRHLSAHSKIASSGNPARLGCPRGVLLFLSLLGMLTAIEFDNQAPLNAAKIGKIITNGVVYGI
jgi:hypothetical protein